MIWTYLGGVGGDSVEDVDQHQEQRDQERHPAGDYVRGDNKTGSRWDTLYMCILKTLLLLLGRGKLLMRDLLDSLNPHTQFYYESLTLEKTNQKIVQNSHFPFFLLSKTYNI